MNITLPIKIRKFIIFNFIYELIISGIILLILISKEFDSVYFKIFIAAVLFPFVDQLFSIILCNIKSKSILHIIKILQDYKFIFPVILFALSLGVKNTLDPLDYSTMITLYATLLVLGNCIIFDLPLVFGRYLLNLEKYKNWYTGFGVEVLKLWGYRVIIFLVITSLSLVLFYFNLI